MAASGLAIAPVPEAGRAPPPDPATAAGLLDAQAAADGLVAGAVDGGLARRAYEANLGVLRAADEMTGAALRMLGRDAPRS